MLKEKKNMNFHQICCIGINFLFYLTGLRSFRARIFHAQI